jgi:endoglucanase
MKSTLIFATSILGASAKILYAGVAESSGEFGAWSATSTVGTGLPGRFGVDYSFINKPAIDTFVDQHKVRRPDVMILAVRSTDKSTRSTPFALPSFLSACARFPMV